MVKNQFLLTSFSYPFVIVLSPEAEAASYFACAVASVAREILSASWHSS